MRTHALWIDVYQAGSFIRPVRRKVDVIVLWMGCIKAFLVGMPPVEERRCAKLSIMVGSMSRLFCELDDGRKIFSISFPFVVRVEEDGVKFFSRDGVEIDNRISSEVLSLLDRSDGGGLDAVDFDGFIEPIFESLDVDHSIWSLLRELMLAEEAYLRYDYDNDRINGHLHPEHHIDVGYSSSCTFKVGLRRRIDQDFLVSLMDTETECHYIGDCGVA